MAYCRVGDDSDVYAYRTFEGYTIHVGVANLKYDRQVFSMKTLQDLERWMCDLRDMGYKVPDRTFERIRKELNA